VRGKPTILFMVAVLHISVILYCRAAQYEKLPQLTTLHYVKS